TTNQAPYVMNVNIKTDQAAKMAGTLKIDHNTLAGAASERPRTTAAVAPTSHTSATTGTSQPTTSARRASASGKPYNQTRLDHNIRASSISATPTESARDAGCAIVSRSHSQQAQAAPTASNAMNQQGFSPVSVRASTTSSTAAVITR